MPPSTSSGLRFPFEVTYLNKKAARVGGLSCSLSTCQLAHVSLRDAPRRVALRNRGGG